MDFIISFLLKLSILLLVGVALFALFSDLMKGVYKVYDSLFGWRVVLLLVVIAAIPLRRRRRG